MAKKQTSFATESPFINVTESKDIAANTTAVKTKTSAKSQLPAAAAAVAATTAAKVLPLPPPSPPSPLVPGVVLIPLQNAKKNDYDKI